MQGQAEAPCGPRKLLALGGQSYRFKQRNWHVRTQGFWLNHLYSQIRSHSSCGNDCAPPFADPEDVPCTDVLVRPWRLRRRYHKRRISSATLASSLVLLALLTICGCGKRASLEKAYAEARLQFQQGFADQPLQLAETSYKESTPYPDLNWKFRVLTAEARARKGLFAQALELLQPDPPADAPAEVFVRRRLAQESSLCQLGNYKQAQERLAQAL